jgi:hypothetical protein
MPRKGHPLSEEAKRKLSDGRRGKPSYVRTEAHRLLMSSVTKGRVLSEDHRQMIRERMTGKVPSEETRRRQSEATKGIPKSAETRRRMSEAQKLRGPHRPLSEEHRKKIGDVHRGKPKSEVQRLNMSKAQRNRPPITEQTRQKMSGPNSHNWLGGISQDTRGAPAGAAWRRQVRTRTGGKCCELCGCLFRAYHWRPHSPYTAGAKIGAHIVPYSDGEAPLRTDPANGLLLCGDCHRGLDHGSRWYFALCCGLIHWGEAENPRLLLDALTERSQTR